MKKTLLFLLAAYVLAFSGNAQKEKEDKGPNPSGRDYEDLLLPFVDQKYEKVLVKAEKYTLDEETKKDALPYLFLSMSYFEISKMDDAKMKEKYPDAAKYTLKYVAKYSKLDKKKELAAEYEDFFAELRTSIISDGEIMMDQKKFTKAKTDYTYLLQIDENDCGAKIMMGMVFDELKSKKEAETSYAEAKKMLSEKTCSVTDKVQSDFLKNTLINYASKLASAGDKSRAREWMELGMEWFKDDNEYKVTYESL